MFNERVPRVQVTAENREVRIRVGSCKGKPLREHEQVEIADTYDPVDDSCFGVEVLASDHGAEKVEVLKIVGGTKHVLREVLGPDVKSDPIARIAVVWSNGTTSKPHPLDMHYAR